MKHYNEYIEILKEELVPAMGCTEPIAVAYCAALARKTLGALPESVTVFASPNIIKNVKSVVVPNTGGLKGLEAAAAAGIVAGDPLAELQVLSKVNNDDIQGIGEYLKAVPITVKRSPREYVFDIEIEASYSDDDGKEHISKVEIAGHHTNVVKIQLDGKELLKETFQEQESMGTDRSVLTVEEIIEFADSVNIDDVKDILQRQIDYNTAIAQEGLDGDWGANIGTILLKAYGNDVYNRAKAFAAAGSDARMSGCELPVVINSGSGNQGMTASLPVIVYAEDMNKSQEELFRALVVSNLITIHLKTGIGRLSAYCGATAAGCGAGAGIAYLQGGKYRDVAHTIVNSIAIASGMICDGAKASCAAKIASAVEAGLLGVKMWENGSQFYGGDGIVVKGVENTIKNIGTLASVGMRETDATIIDLMIEKK